MTIEMNLQKGLVGHWTMNTKDTDSGIIRDISGRVNNGEINGQSDGKLTSYPGKVSGEAFNLDGINDYIDLGADIDLDPSGPFSIAGWVRMKEDPDRATLFSGFGSGSDGTAFDIELDPYRGGVSNNNSFGVHTWSGYVASKAGVLPDNGDWGHYVVTYSGGTLNSSNIALYINGSELNITDVESVNNNLFNQDFEIGYSSKNSSNIQYQQMVVDDVRAYSRVLSDSEIKKLYNIRSSRSFGSPYVPQRPVAAGDLVAWYPFEAGDAVDATAFQTWAGDNTDYSGSVNGATDLDSGGVNDIRLGSGSGAYDFDGIEYIDIDTSFTLPEEYTFSVWFNYRNLDDGDFYLLQNVEVNDNTPLFYYNNDTELRIFSDGQGIVSASVSLNQGTWHHAVFTDDGSETRIYHNGTDVGGGGAQNLQYIGDWYLGTANGLDGPTDGLIDDVRIYNRALTESEIFSIYNNTKP